MLRGGLAEGCGWRLDECHVDIAGRVVDGDVDAGGAVAVHRVQVPGGVGEVSVVHEPGQHAPSRVELPFRRRMARDQGFIELGAPVIPYEIALLQHLLEEPLMQHDMLTRGCRKTPRGTRASTEVSIAGS